MEIAAPGKEYNFDHIPISVRTINDPYTVAASHDFNAGWNLVFFKYLGIILFLVGILALAGLGGLIFYEKKQRGKNLTGNYNPYREPN